VWIVTVGDKDPIAFSHKEGMIVFYLQAEGVFRMTDLPNENWKPIPGFEGFYSVSNLGRIRSEFRIVPREGRGNLTIKEKIIKTPPTKGYPKFNANMNGIPTQFFVHQVVMLAFKGPPLPGQEVRHKNGDRGDARLDNLEYGTRTENIADAKRYGTFPVGEKRPGAKINREIARIIIQSEETAYVIAERYGIDHGTVEHIRNRRLWGEFTKDIPKKDYYVRGEKSGQSKITSEDAIFISKSKEPQRVLARKYGVSPRAIWSIRNGHAWQHVTGIKRRGLDPSR
jgi:hypothetical protein